MLQQLSPTHQTAPLPKDPNSPPQNVRVLLPQPSAPTNPSNRSSRNRNPIRSKKLRCRSENVVSMPRSIPLIFFFFFWVSVFSWIFFINQSLRKKNKEEVYFLVLLISVIVKQYVDVIWWMGIEFGLLKVDLFIYLFFLGSDFSGVIVYCRNWQRLGRRRGSHITSLSMWVLFTWLCLL